MKVIPEIGYADYLYIDVYCSVYFHISLWRFTGNEMIWFQS
jgi:hypothetical protein